MYDAGKIIIGLVVFLALVSYPIWYDAARGDIPTSADPKIVTAEKECVAPTDYMKDSHMDLLNQWRDDVVRKGVRVYTAESGRKFEMSLSHTCMDCHSNKSEFCDECHNYAGVNPYCWDCHIEPEEVQQ
ncbi:MAG: sulfate reduction electron transfer complex DsrMKJOP subunit DsrJ [Candidatus Zixiibacteriota bacterium]|nr:MAG: sulfate reduction electron transfer complex DsrMKJOP subunit DsrJ [candidate division Zixibacteria bacterium]